MKAIKLKFDLTRARNAEHYQFHSDMLGILTPAFCAARELTELRIDYQSLFDIENDCYLRNRNYQDTPEVEAADKKRDDLFIFCSQTISTGIYSPVTDYQTAAKRLYFLLKPYINAPRLSYTANTAAVADFVQKMKEEANAADIATLGLTDAIDALETANNRFNALYTGRSAELLSRATSDTMKSIRPRVDTAYQTTAEAINALYLVNELTTKNSSTRQELETVIDRMNAITIQLQTVLSRAGIGAKPTFKPDGSTPTTPAPDEGEDDRPVIE